MIEEVIKHDNTPNSRYRDKYIVTMTPEEKAFIDGTSMAFEIVKGSCSSVEAARDRIRAKMKQSLYFPIWTVGEILNDVNLKTSESVIRELLVDYQDLANNTTNKSESDIANSIGRKFIKMLMPQEICISSSQKRIVRKECSSILMDIKMGSCQS